MKRSSPKKKKKKGYSTEKCICRLHIIVCYVCEFRVCGRVRACVCVYELWSSRLWLRPSSEESAESWGVMKVWCEGMSWWFEADGGVWPDCRSERWTKTSHSGSAEKDRSTKLGTSKPMSNKVPHHPRPFDLVRTRGKPISIPMYSPGGNTDLQATCYYCLCKCMQV